VTSPRAPAAVADALVKTRHPLDPLSPGELRAAVALALAAHRGEGPVRVVDVSLNEPSKEEIRSWTPGSAVAREAWVVLLDRASASTHELVVSLDDEEVVTSRELRDIQPAITPSEFEECERVVRADPRFQTALRARGVTDYDLVTVEAWGIGTHAPEDERHLRLAWTPCWVRDDPDDNPYAHPIDGLFAIVDLNAMQVLRIEEHEATPIPRASGRYQPGTIGAPLRDDLRALDIVQPEGPSFAVEGWQVSWQRWSFRIGFTAREGLVLHQLSYRDGDRDREVVYRASYGELVVPYGDPGPGGYRKAAFDIGEYGLGALTNSLELGCDCLGEIHYFDAHLCDDRGEPSTIANAICLHEEDFGILWKHYDAQTHHAEVRRMRRLVVSSIITAANYEYALYWYLYQDGTIEAEVKPTGIVITEGAEGSGDDVGVEIAPGLIAPHHQHFFCVRLDMAVDGERNTVHEVHTEPVPLGDANPYGNAFRTVSAPLEHEQDARRTIDPLSARYWLIANERVRNALGEPVAYKLVPGSNVLPFAHPDSDVMRRGGFMQAHLWVTRYDPRERFPSGDYPNQHSGGGGLPAYQQANREIRDQDVVVWYTFGSHHISRPEDWPVMPVERLGFALKPNGFFDRNPAIDVPPSPGHDRCGDEGHDDSAKEGPRDVNQ
jgi:primary-amine oxidase